MDVCVQLFGYDEPMIDEAMDAWAEQPYGRDDQVDFWGCVTPKAPNYHTAKAVERHESFRLFETPRGKLSSRNAAHDEAAGLGYDVIVATDADAPPLDRNVLMDLIEPFRVHGAAATMARPVAHASLPGVLLNASVATARKTIRYLHGQCSAISSYAWQQAGPFDTSIDETDIRSVWREEEYDFYRRLRAVGPIHTVNGRVRNDPRRWECRIKRAVPWLTADGTYCDRSGTETFLVNEQRR